MSTPFKTMLNDSPLGGETSRKGKNHIDLQTGVAVRTFTRKLPMPGKPEPRRTTKPPTLGADRPTLLGIHPHPIADLNETPLCTLTLIASEETSVTIEKGSRPETIWEKGGSSGTNFTFQALVSTRRRCLSGRSSPLRRAAEIFHRGLAHASVYRFLSPLLSPTWPYFQQKGASNALYEP
ncbi:hypothetical protein COLO4_20137 [Corchorus olitorius]|uniref:Uncharacterized protein n=1 Tax=Corchorus olitorius TaxID=93759 RepID=A0A1R3J1K4_9ROSI|nr:hypothetical protein COLO4_20137 [Corchorus olitorius]